MCKKHVFDVNTYLAVLNLIIFVHIYQKKITKFIDVGIKYGWKRVRW